MSERLRYSQRLLESAEYSVEQVAALAGFGSAAALRHHFRLHYGVSPMQWQQNFQA